MRTLLPFCLAIITIAVVGGCGRNANDRLLNGIETAIADNPDSALAALDTLDTTLLQHAGDKARYHLLMAEARYKAGFDDTVTNHIDPAVDYYKDHGQGHDASRAYFYSGIVRYNQKHYASAAVDLLRAERVAKEDKDTLQLAFIYRAMGDNFYEVKDYKSSLSYYKKSYEYFKEKGADKYAIHAPYDIARCYLPLSNYRQAIEYALISYNHGKERNDTLMTAYSLGMLGTCYYYMGDYAQTLNSYNEMLKYGQGCFRDQDYYAFGASLLYSGDTSGAREIQKTLSSLDSIPNMLRFRLLLHDGNYKEAIDVLYANLDWQNAALNNAWSTNLAAEIISYEQNEEFLIQESRKRERYLWITIIALVVLTMTLTGASVIRRNKSLRLERDSYMMTIDNLNLSINSISSIRAEAEQQHIAEVTNLMNNALDSHNAIRNLLASKFQDLSELCQIYFQHEKHKNAQSKVYEKVKTLVLRISSDRQFLKDLEMTIDRSLANLMSNFRKDFPNLNDWEYTLLMLNVCGMEPKTIALLTAEKTDLIYKRKANLKKKISNSTFPLRDEYLSYLK